ncbi:MAG: hypothetical protein IH959_09265 [Chloroflexi bacterium]|nr:hypothetical protein [Chloroflexota bacterium]
MKLIVRYLSLREISFVLGANAFQLPGKPLEHRIYSTGQESSSRFLYIPKRKDFLKNLKKAATPKPLNSDRPDGVAF